MLASISCVPKKLPPLSSRTISSLKLLLVTLKFSTFQCRLWLPAKVWLWTPLKLIVLTSVEADESAGVIEVLIVVIEAETSELLTYNWTSPWTLKLPKRLNPSWSKFGVATVTLIWPATELL